MKVGLIGFGKTGRSVASVLLAEPNMELNWVLRQQTETRTASEILEVGRAEEGRMLSTAQTTASELFEQHPVDVVIDFSSAEGITYYGKEAARRGITIITAVSHYPAEVVSWIDKLARRTKVIHSPNITLGVNFLMIAARVLKNIRPASDIEIIEQHFKDKPEISGTARSIARHLDLEESAIKSIRAGGIIGMHEIIFGLPNQTVRLKHESIAREAFGTGVVFALNNLPKRRTGLYTMENLLLPYFQLDGPAQNGRTERSEHRPRTTPWWKIW